ncbi:hypothetical protein BC827DRAFT_1320885 [Russula dissimulans]|nr:hypothetical protein BC827DRAFT_1320885 [Russula dissimulans]
MRTCYSHTQAWTNRTLSTRARALPSSWRVAVDSLSARPPARTQLLELFEDDVARLGRVPGSAERMDAFRANLIRVVAIYTLDLAFVRSTLAFGDEVAHQVWVLTCVCGVHYPYISHLVCNAGVAPFLNISWSLLLRKAWRNLLEVNLFELVTNPSYNIQHTALMSDGGFGWAWRCNVFGHYILYRVLEEKLAGSRTGSCRILWMSSNSAHADDWQLVRGVRPYWGTKFQINLIGVELALYRALRRGGVVHGRRARRQFHVPNQSHHVKLPLLRLGRSDLFNGARSRGKSV